MIKVYCTTDSTYMESITPLINYQEDMVVIDEPDTNHSLMQKVTMTEPDILLIDLDEYVSSDLLKPIKRLRHAFLDLKLVVITKQQKDTNFFTLIESGVDSILPKSKKKEVIDMLRMISKDEFILPSTLALDVASKIVRLKNRSKEEFTIKLEQNDLYLTKREIDIAYLMRRGLKNKQIAAKLDLTNSSVKVYVSHIYRKAGIKNRWKLVKLFNMIFPPVESSKTYSRGSKIQYSELN